MRFVAVLVILLISMFGLTGCGCEKETPKEPVAQTQNKEVEEKEIKVEPPVFVLAAGTYEGEQTLSITAPENTTVHYTTDGTDPTADDPAYEGPFPLLPGRYEIRAVAIHESGTVSVPAVSAYDIKTPEPPKTANFEDALQGLWGHLDTNGGIVLYYFSGNTLQVGYLQSEWQGPYTFDVVESDATSGLLRMQEITMDCHIDLGATGDNKVTLVRSTQEETFDPVELQYISADASILETHSGSTQIREMFIPPAGAA